MTNSVMPVRANVCPNGSKRRTKTTCVLTSVMVGLAVCSTAQSQPCTRSADLSPCGGDGIIDLADVLVVVGCLGGTFPCGPTACDVNCDGDINLVDLAIAECQFIAGSPDPACRTSVLTCNADLSPCTGDGFINSNDITALLDCILGVSLCTQIQCDVNSDGFVDLLDLSVTFCEFSAGSACCSSLVVGACCPAAGSPLACSPADAATCLTSGTFGGPGSACGDGDIAGAGGVCMPDGTVDLQDILAVLDGFSGNFGPLCDTSDSDITSGGSSPFCVPDGVVDLSDILAVLDAFQGIDICCP